MPNQPLVSIIIPTYNRAHLIGETLDSILAQTYTNWECIVVDDGSTDDTEALMAKYIAKDDRFQYHHRPADRLPGGNAARNYGFELSKGEFVQWFDDDDIMLSDKIEKQVLPLMNTSTFTYSVSKYCNFQNKKMLEEIAFRKNQQNAISLTNYIVGDVFWGTIDFVGKRKMLEGSIFNEHLKSGQEFNFFISVLYKNRSYKGIFVDEILSLRRVHDNSIQGLQKSNSILNILNKFNVYLISYKQFSCNLNDKEIRFLLKKSSTYFNRLIIHRSNDISIHSYLNTISKNLLIKQLFVLYFVFSIAFIAKKGDVRGVRLIERIFT